MWQRLLRSRWTYVAGAALLVLAALASMVRIEPAARSAGDLEDLLRLRERDDLNVVFVLVDTLRADHLSSYGYARKTSPFMDELAANGVRFANVRAQSSWTKTSMASLWTGTFPVRNGVLEYSDGMPESLQVAAEVFQKAGYRTGGIFRNGWVAPNFGFGRGFDVYVRPGPTQRQGVESKNPSGHALPGTDYDVTTAAVEFFRGHAKERFFLYLHYMDVHQYLYEEASALFGAQYVDAYDNAIHWTDRNVSLLFKGLNELDLLDRTVVVIASDHGEGFYEHGSEGHGRNLYAEVTTTPWILSLPFNLEGGVTVEPWVRNVDIWPTVLELLGLPPLPQAQGRSLVPLIERSARGEAIDGSAPDVDLAYLNRYWGRVNVSGRPTATLTRDGHRLILDLCDSMPPELFDLKNDRTEQKNVAATEPERLAALKAELLKHLAEDEGAQAKTTEVTLDEFRLEQLKALGYVIEPNEVRPEFAAEEEHAPCEPIKAAPPKPAS
jgi:arylsulfatase A-like enzyme